MATPVCHYCEQTAESQCPTCGRLFCLEHGEQVCMRCMAPEAGVPSAVLYRGAVAALVLGTAVAAFLVFNPPEDEADPSQSSPIVTSTTAPTSTPGASTPGATATADPAGTATAPGQTVYIVQEGDTPLGVAEEAGITLDELIAANPGADFDSFPVGMELIIPAAGGQ